MLCEKCKTRFDLNPKYKSVRFCSRECANSRSWTKADNLKKSRANKGTLPWNIGTALVIEKRCLTCGKKFEAKKWGRKTCSVECERHAPGRSGGYRPNSTRKVRSQYKGFWMDSGAERKFAELLDQNKIEWVKNTTTAFGYRDKEGKQRKYYPDFYLPKYDYWVEIKGRWYQNKNDTLKLDAVGQNIEMQIHNKIRLPSCVR